MTRQELEQQCRQLRKQRDRERDPEQRIHIDQRLYHWEQQLRNSQRAGPAVTTVRDHAQE